ncbi:MAG: NUDIX hydrolase [Firmicutes bacterium]|nr:NUDIX hydrolase [Bacillota bacterium]
MWTGGVRAIVLDDRKRMLLVRQYHDGKDIWMVPGGTIEEGESAADAALREVKEETNLDIGLDGLLWHVEEVSERGQRFVNFFLGHLKDPSQKLVLGTDPELAEDAQVLREVAFLDREEVGKLEVLYPEYLKDEFWQLLDGGQLQYNAFRMRD